jgi:thiol-disulfide isomerase/thioredoxin
VGACVLFALPCAGLGQTRPKLPLSYAGPVAGAPFSAVVTLDFEPTEGSGEKAFHAEMTMYRDADGRTRSEFRYPDQLPTVDILDFPTHTHYDWTVGDTVVTQSVIPQLATPASTTAAEPLPADAPVIEGLATRHSHITHGSDETNKYELEMWYSPEMRLAMESIYERANGKSTYRYTQMKRDEPDAALFRVPVGFTISDPKQAPPPVKTVAATRHEPYMDDPKFQKAVAQAKAARNLEDRLDDWKHANKLAEGRCVECLHAMIDLQRRFGATKDAVKSAEQLEALTPDDPHEHYFAEASRGGALMSANYGQPKPEQVAQAEAAFHDVLAYSPKSSEVMYQEGRALAMEGRDEEAKAMFARYVDLVPPSDRLRRRAERFSDDPHLATLQMAPPFRLVTAQGEDIQLDEMNGRVVVLDFWATWCGPCRETLPEIKRIAKDYANDPMLVLISVSQDADEGVWRAFVQKNGMDWPQYRDGNKTLGAAYGVTSIPHFFTIDTNGVLKTEQVGSGADVRHVVDEALKKAHKAEARKTVAGSAGAVASHGK